MSLGILKIKVIGSGGVGTQLLPTLSRILNFGSVEYEFDGAELEVIDGDTFEESNRPRQQFKDRGNKADITVATLENDFPNVEYRSRPVYITESNIDLLIKEGDLVFSCVDNHATRKLLTKHCEGLDNVTLVSGGNELVDGNVQIFRRVDGENYTMPLDNKFHPEILEPDDENPGDNDEEKEEGCIEMQESAPQLLVTNFLVAALMLEAFHHFLMDTLDYDETFFDMKTGNFRRRYESHAKADKDAIIDAIMKKLRMMKKLELAVG